MDSQVNCYLDRFEGSSAVILIHGNEMVVPASILPEGVREGDHLLISVSIDTAARKQTGREVSELQQKLEIRDAEE